MNMILCKLLHNTIQNTNQIQHTAKEFRLTILSIFPVIKSIFNAVEAATMTVEMEVAVMVVMETMKAVVVEADVVEVCGYTHNNVYLPSSYSSSSSSGDENSYEFKSSTYSPSYTFTWSSFTFNDNKRLWLLSVCCVLPLPLPRGLSDLLATVGGCS